jgi:hypothetical protein
MESVMLTTAATTILIIFVFIMWTPLSCLITIVVQLLRHVYSRKINCHLGTRTRMTEPSPSPAKYNSILQIAGLVSPT